MTSLPPKASALDLEELKRLEEAATPGPWTLNDRALCLVDWHDESHLSDVAIAYANRERDDYDQITADLVFCAAMRTAASSLISELAAARSELAELRRLPASKDPGAQSASAEAQVREMLYRAGIEGASSITAGNLVELANLVAERDALRAALDRADARLVCAAISPMEEYGEIITSARAIIAAALTPDRAAQSAEKGQKT